MFISIIRVFYTSIVSLLTVSFTCNNDSGRTMFYFPDNGEPTSFGRAYLRCSCKDGEVILGVQCAAAVAWGLLCAMWEQAGPNTAC